MHITKTYVLYDSLFYFVYSNYVYFILSKQTRMSCGNATVYDKMYFKLRYV